MIGSCLISSPPAFDDLLLRPRQHGELNNNKKTRWERLFRRVSLHLFFFASLRGARPTSRVPFIIRHLNSDKHSVRKGDSEGWLVFSEFGQLFESVSSRYEHPSSSNTLQDKQHADRLLVKLLLQRYIPLRIGDAAVVLIPVVRA